MGVQATTAKALYQVICSSLSSDGYPQCQFSLGKTLKLLFFVFLKTQAPNVNVIPIGITICVVILLAALGITIALLVKKKKQPRYVFLPLD